MLGFIAVAFGAFYYAWGKHEYGSGISMAALSGGASGLAMLIGWRMFGVFFVQAALGILFLAWHLTRPMKKHI